MAARRGSYPTEIGWQKRFGTTGTKVVLSQELLRDVAPNVIWSLRRG
ncbi:hypothetical protein FHS94_000012 [Sphingomonas aerophila]|uniref:Uncharacterized protein n=1 Tax=Sphingomonas aerophila TaxID=1344948 RepID=A0A7W9B9P6_9SPHN|nr:hypothetical protein [Sphingomonas aerophila]